MQLQLIIGFHNHTGPGDCELNARSIEAKPILTLCRFLAWAVLAYGLLGAASIVLARTVQQLCPPSDT